MATNPETRPSLTLRWAQVQVYQNPARFRVVVAGRRFGKTHLALVELLRAADKRPGTIAWYVAPSYRQAKDIAWDRLKSISEPFWANKPNETELTVFINGGGTISLKGADKYDSLRGRGLDFVVLDEYASMRPECWTEVLRPALADKQGKALFIGTPQGADHLMETFERGQKSALEGGSWAAFQFTTLEGGNVTAAELADAARDLDPKLFRQEFEASFEGALEGRVYYAFSREGNVRKCTYTPNARLIWTMDFNVNPMCAVLAQHVDGAIQVLDEIILRDANTPEACEAFLTRVNALPKYGSIAVQVYGDASGNQRRTSSSATDWQIVRDFFARHRGQITLSSLATNTSNPAVRDRVNCINGMLLNAAGERRLFIDPKCAELIRDLERVTWKTANGVELDKSDPARTHVSDALGYYVAAEFNMKAKIGPRCDGPIL